MRKAMILVMALGLGGVGPAPLTACALFSSPLTECATPKTESRCEQMDMGEAGVARIAPEDGSCCVISRAPVQEAQTKASGLSLTAVALVSPDLPGKLPAVQRGRRGAVVPELSPPTLQSLFCTFLI